MKLLLVHNFYGSSARSGENLVFEAEKQLLQSHGHEVEVFTRHSDEIRSQGAFGVLRGAMATPWNPFAAANLKRALRNFAAEVVHVHNTFPLISPSIFYAVGQRAARVLTLHNYRLFCSAGIPMREGRVCTLCLDRRSAWSAVKYGCYRRNRLATLPLALSVEVHRGLDTWARQVDAFAALSDFQRELMIDAGLPSAKVHVKPNFYPGNPRVLPWDQRSQYAVFVGRLTVEKGVKTLIEAWRRWGKTPPELRIVGDGELRGSLERLAAGLPIRFLGRVDAADAQAQIAGARLLILPSEWFEGFPMVLREAFAFGTPVAVSNIGPLPSLVQAGVNGLVFEPGSATSLLSVVRDNWPRTEMLATLGQGARSEFESKYTEDANYATLKSIYDQAITLAGRPA